MTNFYVLAQNYHEWTFLEVLGKNRYSKNAIFESILKYWFFFHDCHLLLKIFKQQKLLWKVITKWIQNCLNVFLIFFWFYCSPELIWAREQKNTFGFHPAFLVFPFLLFLWRFHRSLLCSTHVFFFSVHDVVYIGIILLILC